MNEDELIIKKDEKFIARTTVYLPRELLESAKMMALLTRSNVSHIMRIALREKIKNLKEEFKEKK